MNTRKFSNRQEKSVARAVGGRQTANSGASAFSKGDVVTDKVLIECKTKVRPSTSITVKREWIDKNAQEAFAMRKPYSAVAFDFGDDERFYIISERLFKILLDRLEEENDA